MGVATSTIVNYGTGHAVPQTSAPLTTVYTFFKQYLTPPSMATGIVVPTEKTIPLTLSPNPTSNKVQLTFNLSKPGDVRLELYNLSGRMLYKNEKHVECAGIQTDTINLAALNLAEGVYYVKVDAGGFQGINKFVKN
jgi:hypothetical protein